MKFKKLINISITCFALLLWNVYAYTQERIVKVDFETENFQNSSSIPFDQPFIIEGEVYRDVEYVDVVISNANAKHSLYTYSWNRGDKNETASFSIVVPGGFKSSSKYDFYISTYKLLTDRQREDLVAKLKKRIMLFLKNKYVYDGKKITINKPKKVFNELKRYTYDGLAHLKSKNGIAYTEPSSLIYDELKKDSDLKFKKILKHHEKTNRDSVAMQMIDTKVAHLADLIILELDPFLNANLVQHYRNINIKSVPTDKERFSLPVNFGMYAWNKNASVDNVDVNNTNFTAGLGLTIPFAKTSRSKILDGLGLSLGVLLQPVKDANKTSFVTPGLSLPVYTALGFRFFKIARLNTGVLIVGEKGLQDYKKLEIVPTVGLAFELNLWMGVKNKFR